MELLYCFKHINYDQQLTQKTPKTIATFKRIRVLIFRELIL